MGRLTHFNLFSTKQYLFCNKILINQQAMKKLLLIICTTIVANVQAQNNVGIGTTAPNSKAILELQAIDKGLLTPRMTNIQMLAITSPPNGLLIYNTTKNCFYYFDNVSATWKDMCSIGALGKDTLVLNIVQIDSLFAHLIKTDTLLSKTITTNYINSHYIVTDSIGAHLGRFDSLYVGGKNISKIITDSIASQAWLTKGNVATNSYKLGTLNARDLHIVTNNNERITIMSGTGNVGIGQTLPSAKLDVLGNVKALTSVEFGTDLKPAGLAGAVGQYLTSAGTGVAPTWTNVTIPTTTVSNTLTGNNLTTTVNGVTGAPIDLSTIVPTTTVNNTYNTTTGALSTTVNGVTGANVIIPTPQSIKDTVIKNAWLINGNSVTTAGTNFIGTTDAKDLIFKTDNKEHLKINANGQITITVKDTGNYITPVNIGTVPGVSPIACKVVGNYLFVINYYGGQTFTIYSLANLSAPVLVASVPTTGGWPASFEIIGNYVYITFRLTDRFQVIDVSNPHNPFTVSTTSFLYYAYGIQTIDTNYVYISDGNVLQIINMSNSISPTLVSTDVTKGMYHSQKRGNYLYVCNLLNSSFEIWNVANPLNPTTIGSLNIGGFGSLCVTGNYVYLSNYTTNNVDVIDISIPASPVLVTSLPALGGSLKLYGRYLYVTTGNNVGTNVIDINNPASPVLVNTIPTPGGVGLLDVKDDYLYLPYYATTGIGVFRIGNPYSLLSPALSVKLINSSATIARFENTSGACLVDHNGIHSSSDLTLKHNIQVLPLGTLSKLTSLRGVTFSWNNDPTEKQYSGTIAQEVLKQFPLLVTTDDKTGKYAVNYAGFAPYFIEAIKELNTKADTKINLLEQEIQLLKKQNETILQLLEKRR
jgi:hypothetical protein